MDKIIYSSYWELLVRYDYLFSTGHLDTHNVDPVEELGNYYFPERNEFRNSKCGTSQLVAAGPFPKRLGLQSDDFVTAGTSRGMFTTISHNYIS